MNNNEVQKLVRDFESAASQPEHNFSSVYQDLTELEKTAPDHHAYMQEVMAANQALMSAGAIPESAYPGYPDFVVLGTDGHGDIVTGNPLDHQLQYRNENMQLLGDPNNPYDDMPSGMPFHPRHFDLQGSQCAADGSQPGSPEQAAPTPESNPQTPQQEQWGGRTFELQPDGSAQYTVKSGDTVWAVAQSYLEGNGNSNPSNTDIANEVNSIAQASQLQDPNLIYPGNVLKVPGPNGESQPAESTSTGDTSPPAQPQQPGSPTTSPTDSSTPQPSTPAASPTDSSAPQPPAGSTLQQLQALGLNINNPVDKIVYMLAESQGGPQSVNWSDNGDGISVGMYQANQAGGNLSILFQAMQQADPTDFNNIFGSNASALVNQSELANLQFSPSNQLGQELQQALEVPQMQEAELTLDRQRVEQFAQQAQQQYGITSSEGVALYAYMMNWGPALAQQYFAGAANVSDQSGKIQAVLSAAEQANDVQAASNINTTIGQANQLGMTTSTTFAA